MQIFAWCRGSQVASPCPRKAHFDGAFWLGELKLAHLSAIGRSQAKTTCGRLQTIRAAAQFSGERPLQPNNPGASLLACAKSQQSQPKSVLCSRPPLGAQRGELISKAENASESYCET
jgi:hypothetical protein